MTQSSLSARAMLAALAIPVAILTWAWWPTLTEMAQRWSHDEAYSHGWLVPLFALALLFMRRDQAPAWPWSPSWWGGLVLAGGIGLRLYGAYYGYIWFDQVSIVLAVAGLCLMIGGAAMWRWAWPGILFLAFMIPLPYRLSVKMAGPLQEFATVTSTFLLQTMGVPALQEGRSNILLSHTEMAIVEACSGLRMLVVFFALSTAVALVLKRPIWERLLVVASAVPIALAVNVLRITSTGVLHETVGSEIADAVFHDFAGWLMMPVALGFLWVELQVLSRLLLPAETSDAPRVEVRREAVPVPAGKRSSRKAATPLAAVPSVDEKRRRQPTATT
jgi:exosortase